MAAWSLILMLGYAIVAFGARTFLQYRRTGSTGWRGISGSIGSVEWLGGFLFVVALVLAFAAPILALAGALRSFDVLPEPTRNLGGLLLYAVGTLGTVWAQASMGASWRIGVDAGERTTLMTAGPFRYIRNPIFSFTVVATSGLALLVPNIVSLLSVALLSLAVWLQVRFVEEPYLLRAHGAAYAAYAAKAGRFIPGMGRLRADTTS